VTKANDTPTPPLSDPLAASAENAEEEIASIADRYTVLCKLGQGGMGRVFKAHDRILDRDVAVKLLNRELCDNHFVLRFQQEARAASQLKHPSILCVLDFGLLSSRQPYMVMEWVDGESLQQRIEREGSVNVAEALHITLQLAEGMNHAHEKGIIHRDLKPANIMLTKTDQGEKALILDFGIAKIERDRGEGMLTLTGQIVGSPTCISPEQARGELLDRRTDIYALGCVLYWMITGSPPYQGDSALATINMHLTEPIPSVSEHSAAHLPETLERIIEKMLAKSAKDRFATMAEVKRAVESICFEPIQTSLSAEPTKADNKERSTVFSTRQRWLIAVAAFLLCASGVVAGIVWTLSATKKNTATEIARKKMTKSSVLDDNMLTYAPKNIPKDVFSNTFAEARGLNEEDYIVLDEQATSAFLERGLKEKARAFHVRAYGTKITPQMLDLLEKHHRINQLRFQRTSISVESLNRICSFRHLEELKFVNQTLSTSTLSRLKNNSNLINIQIYNSNLQDADLREILACKHLRVLELNGNEDFSYEQRRLIANLKDLTILHFDHANLDDRDLNWISSIRTLETLSLNDNGPFSKTALKKLNGLEKLEELDLQRTGMNIQTMSTLSSLPNLKVLDVSGNKNVNSAGVRFFNRRPQMKIFVSDTAVRLDEMQTLSEQLRVSVNAIEQIDLFKESRLFGSDQLK